MSTPESKMDAIAKRIVSLRMQKGFSQKAMAAAAGLNRVQYNKYENGAMVPSTESLSKIANVLDVTVDYLLEGREEGAAVANLSDRELITLFEEVEKFPPAYKQTVKETLRAFVTTNKVEQLRAS